MEATNASLLELLKEQIKYLKNEDYSYKILTIYLAGDSEGFEFDYEDEFKLDQEKGILVVTDGPTEDNSNKGIPEVVLYLNAVVASQLR